MELVFWQSIANSTDPADFEAYLAQFPNRVFRSLAQNRLAALEASGIGGVGSPASGARPAGSGAGLAAGVDAPGQPGAVMRPDQTCAGQPAGTACWIEITGRPRCYVWNPSLVAVEAAVTWTGECAGGVAQGSGALAWVWDGGNQQTEIGRLRDARHNGGEGHHANWEFGLRGRRPV